LVYDPYAPRLLADIFDLTMTGLDKVMADSDVVVCLTPLTSETRGMINAEALELLRPGSVLVNVAKGEVIDTDALVRCQAARAA
jgi:D-3-phosphoglycerate dehydrogenase / 2-oxoglutarate reductase